MSDKRPAHTIRLGKIKATIWRNTVEGRTLYNTTIRRTYKDGNTFKDSDSFGRDDLLLVAKVGDLAHTWVCEQLAKERTEQENGEE
jgi:hypothetical protein